jgi:ketosteroid isomerase-like protein
MRANQRLVIEAVYASWAAHDLEAVCACLHRDAVYKQHLPPGAWPLFGSLHGKQQIVRCLAQFLHGFDVIDYRPLKISCADGISESRAKIHYVHKTTGHSFEATVRNIAHIEGDKIRSFEVIHDGPRLRAFYEMVSHATVDA